jgi:hypothetical protein
MSRRKLGDQLGKEVKPIQVYICLGLMVKARRAAIEALMPEAWLGNDGPYVLNWGVPCTHTEPYDPSSVRPPPSPSPKHINLVLEEEVQLLVWYVARPVGGPEKGFPVQVNLNSDADIAFELGDLQKPHVDIAIRFIAKNYADKKMRHFRLIAESWDKLSLIERG